MAPQYRNATRIIRGMKDKLPPDLMASSIFRDEASIDTPRPSFASSPIEFAAARQRRMPRRPLALEDVSGAEDASDTPTNPTAPAHRRPPTYTIKHSAKDAAVLSRAIGPLSPNARIRWATYPRQKRRVARFGRLTS